MLVLNDRLHLVYHFIKIQLVVNLIIKWKCINPLRVSRVHLAYMSIISKLPRGREQSLFDKAKKLFYRYKGEANIKFECNL